LHKAWSAMPLSVYAAPNITVTAANPLIIQGTVVNADYGTVTLEPGGYIEIQTTCTFRCDTLVKSSSSPRARGPAPAGPANFTRSVPAGAADLIIVVVDGVARNPGDLGSAGANGPCGADWWLQ